MRPFKRLKKAFNDMLPGRQQRKDHELFLGAMNNSAWTICKNILQEYPEAVSWRDESGATALHYAASYNSPNMIDYLLDLGADIEARDKRGYSPLHFAANVTGEKSDAVNALLKRGADSEARTKHGNTPLMHTLRHKRTAAMTALILGGADIEAANNTDNTPAKEVKLLRQKWPDLYDAFTRAVRELSDRQEAARREAERLRTQETLKAVLKGIKEGTTRPIRVVTLVPLKK